MLFFFFLYELKIIMFFRPYHCHLQSFDIFQFHGDQRDLILFVYGINDKIIRSYYTFFPLIIVICSHLMFFCFMKTKKSYVIFVMRLTTKYNYIKEDNLIFRSLKVDYSQLLCATVIHESYALFLNRTFCLPG